MNRGRVVRTGIAAIALAAALLGVGCSTSGSEVAPDVAKESTSSAPCAVSVFRPTVAEAEAAVLRLAKGEYPDIPITEASIRSMGQDSRGRWWVRGLTPVPGYETEQWFVTFDGADWVVQDSGTGMEEADFPSDIAWEDVQ